MNDQPTTLHAPDLSELSAYLDGELDAAAQRRLAAHLASCPACADLLAQLQALSAGFRALPAETLGFDLAGVIEGRLATAPRALPVRRRSGWAGLPVALGAAASIAAGVFMGSALVTGGVAATPRMAALRVFDTMPPGSLCIGLESCYATGAVK